MSTELQSILSLDEVRPEPLFQQVADRLVRFIQAKQLGGGDQLPTARELAQDFAVNELTVRRGIKILVQQGLLYGRQGKGVFVTRKGGQPHVLWICGQPQFAASGQTYYPVIFESVRRELALHGVGIESLWEPPQDPGALRDYCLQGSMFGYAGFFFLGCGPQSGLVRHVQQQQQPYVMLTDSRQHWSVYNDNRQAYRLGLGELAGEGGGRVTILTLTDAASTLSVRQRDIAAAVPPGSGLAPEALGIEYDQHLEAEGYRLIMELASQGRLAERLFVTNDLIAKGASRAVLALRCGGEPAPSRIVVVAGIQQVIPLGVPVTYVGQDVREEARQAVNILMGAMRDDRDAPTMAETRFYMWHDDGDGQGAPDLNTT